MTAAQDKNTDIFDVMAIFWRRKWTVLLVALLAQAVAVVVWVKAPVRYFAQSQFIFKTGAADNGLSDLAMLVGKRAGGAKTDISAYFDIILFTDEFLEQLLNRKWKAGADSVTLAALWKVPPSPDGDQRKFLSAQLGHFRDGKYLRIDKSVRPGLIEMVTAFEDPEVTYQANVFIAGLLNEYLLNNNKSQASENRKFVERRLEEVEEELRENEEKFLDFSLANQSVSSPALMLKATRHKRAVEISQEVYLQLKKQVELAKIEERKEAPLIEMISKPQVPMGPGRRLDAKAYVVITAAGIFLGLLAALAHHFTAAALGSRPKA